MSNLLRFPDRNLFPKATWTEYINKTKMLGNLRETQREIESSINLVESDLDQIRKELVRALECGAAIEDAGRIAG